jgi:hypothetical protein
VQSRPLLAFAALLALLTGCAKEVGRLPFAAEGKASVTLPLKAGKVDFWTDIAIDYQGDAGLEYLIAVEQGGAKVATAICNPLGHVDSKSGWSESNLGGSHSRKGSGKMMCSLKLAAGGPTTIRATLAFASKPTSLGLTKADLVVKQ